LEPSQILNNFLCILKIWKFPKADRVFRIWQQSFYFFFETHGQKRRVDAPSCSAGAPWRRVQRNEKNKFQRNFVGGETMAILHLPLLQLNKPSY
jgi:hypothetical protein